MNYFASLLSALLSMPATLYFPQFKYISVATHGDKSHEWLQASPAKRNGQLGGRRERLPKGLDWLPCRVAGSRISLTGAT